MPPLSMFRAHQMERSRSGIGVGPGAEREDPRILATFTLGEDDGDEHGDEQQAGP